MKPYLQDADLTLYHGDVLATLRELSAKSVDCVITSPPYWGLRNYGMPGQLGLEATPEQYVERMVEVFREVRRVLRKHGTLWLNIGNTYAANRSYQVTDSKHTDVGNDMASTVPAGYKPKDLIGVPWMLAEALQAPYYTGRIRSETDRVWLAAMVEAEGCMFIHRRKAGTDSGAKFTKQDGTEVSYFRTKDTFGAGLEVTSTDRAIVERCMEIACVGSVCEQTPEQNARRKQPLYRWNLRSNECRWVIHELYPYFVAKQHEARLLLGCPSSGDDASKAWSSLKALHQGQSADIDFAEPESLFERGWYLRSDIIWSKIANPMPGSFTDRPTTAHEYVFLFAKNERYYFDQEAVREPFSEKWKKSWEKHPKNPLQANADSPYREMGNTRGGGVGYPDAEGRNIRSVWHLTSQPFPGAHFAVFPEELVRRALLAGCPEKVCEECGKPSERIVEREKSFESGSGQAGNLPTGKQDLSQAETNSTPDIRMGPTVRTRTLGWTECGHNAYRPGVVLDPFGGSGTTAFVARKHGRHSVLIELNAGYCEIISRRLAQQSLFA